MPSNQRARVDKRYVMHEKHVKLFSLAQNFSWEWERLGILNLPHQMAEIEKFLLISRFMSLFHICGQLAHVTVLRCYPPPRLRAQRCEEGFTIKTIIGQAVPKFGIYKKKLLTLRPTSVTLSIHSISVYLKYVQYHKLQNLSQSLYKHSRPKSACKLCSSSAHNQEIQVFHYTLH